MTRKSADAGRSTIRDVAARAGVSASTVSRVLGGVYPVSSATRTRVMRAVRDLDYVADARAKAVAAPIDCLRENESRCDAPTSLAK